MKAFVRKKTIFSKEKRKEKRIVAVILAVMMMLSSVLVCFENDKNRVSAEGETTQDLDNSSFEDKFIYALNSGRFDKEDMSYRLGVLMYYIFDTCVEQKDLNAEAIYNEIDNSVEFNLKDYPDDTQSKSFYFNVDNRDYMFDIFSNVNNYKINGQNAHYDFDSNIDAIDGSSIISLRFMLCDNCRKRFIDKAFPELSGKQIDYSAIPNPILELSVKCNLSFIDTSNVKLVYKEGSNQGKEVGSYINHYKATISSDLPSSMTVATEHGIREYVPVYGVFDTATPADDDVRWVTDPAQIEINPANSDYKYAYVKFRDTVTNELVDTMLFGEVNLLADVTFSDDLTAPHVVSTELVLSAPNGAVCEDFDNAISTPYISYLSTVNYKITVEDKGGNTGDKDGVGVDKLYYNGVEYTVTNNVAYIPYSCYSSENNKITIVDKVGNTSNGNDKLREVIYFNSNADRVVSYKIYGTETLLEGSATNDGKPTDTFEKTGYSYSSTVDNVRCNLNIKTPYEITNVRVIYGTNGENTLFSKNNGFNKQILPNENVYQYSIEPFILRDSNSQIKLDNLKLEICYSEASKNQVISLGSLMFDNKAPTIYSACLTRNINGYPQHYLNDKIVLDTTKDLSMYMIRVEGLSDDGSGFGNDLDDYIRITAGPEWDSEKRTGSLYKYSSQTHYYKLDQADIDAIKALDYGDTYDLYLVVKDNAGNIFSKKVISISRANTEINFSGIELKDSYGNVVNFNEDKAVADGYKLYAEVKSYYPLNNIYLTKGSEQGTSEFELTDNESEIINEGYGRRITKLAFNIPSINADSNEFYDALTLHVEDANGNYKEVNIGQLIYDCSKPYVDTLEYKTTWVKPSEAVLKYNIKAGSDSIESELKEASYHLDGTTHILQVAGKTETGEKIIMVPETTDPNLGTKIKFYAKDMAGNTITDLNGAKPTIATLFVDGTRPNINSFTVDGKSAAGTLYNTVPRIDVSYSDNLAIGKVVCEVTLPDGSKKNYDKTYGNNEKKGIDVSDNFTFLICDENGETDDGKYEVAVTVYDKAGNSSKTIRKSFIIDNTLPKLQVYITDGVAGGKNIRLDNTDYYYRSDVKLVFVVEEENFNQSLVTVTDNGKEIPVYWHRNNGIHVAYGLFTDEGAHSVRLTAKDGSMNEVHSNTVTFYIDKNAPTISSTVNGTNYNYSDGMVYYNGNVNLSTAVYDATVDNEDFNMQIFEKKPNTEGVLGDYVTTEKRNFEFSREAEYTVNLKTSDMANNKSEIYTVKIRVDKTAPNVNLNVYPENSMTTSPVSISYSMNEAFWWDASCRMDIYRSAGDGQIESLYRTETFTPSDINFNGSDYVSESGAYRVVITGRDKAGNEAAVSKSFSIDTVAPEIKINGVNNYDLTEDSINFLGEVFDNFYATKTVNVNGTVLDMYGKSEDIDFGALNQTGNPTSIPKLFENDGIYDIKIDAVDKAGNTASKSVHFTVDKTAPIISKPALKNGVTNQFSWIVDPDELVTDLTVCNTMIYINEKQYDGSYEIIDGAYKIRISSVDELGHESEMTFNFQLDTKAPVFIVTGVEDGDVKRSTYEIGVSLQLDEDTLTGVWLNNEAIDITNNHAQLIVDKKGDYVLTMEAVDDAGNISTYKISFRYGFGNLWLIILFLVILLLILLLIGYLIYRYNKKSREE